MSMRRGEMLEEEHYRLLDEFDLQALSDSCCEICHCDCYGSHRSSELSVSAASAAAAVVAPTGTTPEREDDADGPSTSKRMLERLNSRADNNNNNSKISSKETKTVQKNSSTVDDAQRVAQKTTRNLYKKKKRSSIFTNCNPSLPVVQGTPSVICDTTKRRRTKLTQLKRPKSANHSRRPGRSHSEETPPSDIAKYASRDCEILGELLNSFREDNVRKDFDMTTKTLPRNWPLMSNDTKTTTRRQSRTDLRLCDSMATLCLAPTVRRAFDRVPSHDKKILNRMAHKRSENAIAKENAWLARKYWENERYERELLKCEQMEEYKRAVRDKQFQDYLQTKARLNEIAQRDLAELQRLKQTLSDKDKRAKKRLDAIRVERGIMMCQRRCDELRRCEAANVQQEDQMLDESIRRQEICQRLAERLHRAEHIRSQMLESYLKRIRYDNYIEQLLHEEHWRETQQTEAMKRQQLKEYVSQKRQRSQRFVETRQRRNEAVTHTAKISASLRQLVRSSVTPEGAGIIGGGLAATGNSLVVPMSLSRLIHEKSISKL